LALSYFLTNFRNNKNKVSRKWRRVDEESLAEGEARRPQLRQVEGQWAQLLPAGQLEQVAPPQLLAPQRAQLEPALLAPPLTLWLVSTTKHIFFKSFLQLVINF
jgi:hypothetical protein